MSPTTRRKVDEVRKGRFDSSKSDTEVANTIIAMKGDKDEIGKISNERLRNDGLLSKLGLDEFIAIKEAKKVDSPTKIAIGKFLQASSDANIKIWLTDPDVQRFFLINRNAQQTAQSPQAQPNTQQGGYRPGTYNSRRT
jgi:hypothetical protein